jgi:hypothetical protein
MFKFICHHCSNLLEHEEDLVGEHVQCDECEGIFVVDQVELDESALPTLSDPVEGALLPEIEEVAEPSEDALLAGVDDVAALSEDVELAGLENASSSTFPAAAPSTAAVGTTTDAQSPSAGKKPIGKRAKIAGAILLGLAAATGFYMTGHQSDAPAPLEETRSQQTAALSASPKTATPTTTAAPTKTAAPAKTAVAAKTAAPATTAVAATTATPTKRKNSTKPVSQANTPAIDAGGHATPAPKSGSQQSVGAQGQELVLQGRITGRRHVTKKRMIYELYYGFEGKKIRTSGAGGKNARNIDYSKHVGKYVTLTGTGKKTDKDIFMYKITRVEPLQGAELDAYLNALNSATTRVFDDSPNALPFAGTWGPRLSLPTGKQPDVVDNFKVSDFAKQFSKLKSASYVMVNVTQPSGPCYFSAPNLELSKISSTLNASMPQRDLLGEVLDAIAKDGKKAIVYFACEGFHKGDDTRPQKEKDMRLVWDQYVESMGVSTNELLGQLVVGYYAKQYGSKIHGWWFDGAGVLDKEDRLLWRKLVREGNPEAIVSFNKMAGPPFRSTPECDIFGGHPTPRLREHFWSMVNLPMVEGIEAGAWMDPEGKPVDEPGMGALGHVFMGMQDRWNSGKCEFPPEQAIEWTQRVLKAGGMYTWHGPRTQSVWAKGQFDLLLKIDAAVSKMRQQN